MPTMARIHYEIDDDLHRKVKSAAALRGTTLKQFIVDALAAEVERDQASARTSRRSDR